jgi:asparagine synthase (glutamine-hydrolysing)
MLRELVHDPWHKEHSRCDQSAGAALGMVALAESNRGQLAWDATTRSGIVLDGELFESSRVAEALRREGVEVPGGDQAALLLAGWRYGGRNFLRGLHGSFAAAIWDGGEQTLTLITDRFATRPIYYKVASEGLRFSSGLASLLAGDTSPRKISPRGLAQFFTFGHYQRDDTALADARVLPAAACFTFRAPTQRLEPATYWSLRESKVKTAVDRLEWLEWIDDAFTTAVRRCTLQTPHLGMSLSGGLDARTMLGVMDTHSTPLQTVCMGVRGSLDHRSSAELSRLAGCPYHAHILDASFLSNYRTHLDRMVQLTDGQYMSQCIVIPTLGVYRELGIHTLLRGHAGELMHMRKAYNYSLDEAALQIRTGSQLREWLLGHLPAFLQEGVTGPLFAPQYQTGFRELACRSLDEDLADVAHIEQPLARIWSLFVQQRLRRETVLSMVKFRTVVEPRMPILDADLVPLLLAAPTDMKLGEEIQLHILRRHRPEFLRVTNANTGASLGAGAWVQRAATLQMKVLAKLGVPGYQPYERLTVWLKRELAPLVREILLDPRTLDRGVYDPAGVRAAIRQHEQGHNRTYLLMCLMIFELGLRRLIDGGRGVPATAGLEPVAAGGGAAR